MTAPTERADVCAVYVNSTFAMYARFRFSVSSPIDLVAEG